MQEVTMPKVSDTMDEGKILTWLKHEGDAVKRGEAIAEVETEKVTIEIECYQTGILRKILVQAGESAPIGAPIALVGTAGEPLPATVGAAALATGARDAATSAAPQPITVQAVPIAAATVATNGRVIASPLARRVAAEHQVDLHAVQGTGPNRRIIKDDVEAAIAAHAVTGPVTGEIAIVPARGMNGDTDEIVPLSSMRRTIATRLQQSMQTAPHFYVTMVMDAENLIVLRTELNVGLETQGDATRVSYNDLVIMAVARTLARHPEINVSFQPDRLIRHKAIHLGMAVALESGLIVPVLRDANLRTASEIARETRRLREAAQAGKLRPEEFQGATFTISNLGMLDVDSFTAIINPPEAAILAVGAIAQTPVVWEGQVVARHQIKMTLSSDHRAIDGAQAAYFMRDLKSLIETPALLLL